MEKLGEDYLYGQVTAIPYTGSEDVEMDSKSRLELYVAEVVLGADFSRGRCVIAGGMARDILAKDKNTYGDVDVFYFDRRHFLKQSLRLRAAIGRAYAQQVEIARIKSSDRTNDRTIWVDAERHEHFTSTYADEVDRSNWSLTRLQRLSNLFALYPRSFRFTLRLPGCSPSSDFVVKINLIYCGLQRHKNPFSSTMELLDTFDINVARAAVVPWKGRWYLVAHSTAVWDGLTRVASYNEHARSGLPVKWFSRKRRYLASSVHARASKYVHCFGYTLEPESFKRYVKEVRRQVHSGEIVSPHDEPVDATLNDALREFAGVRSAADTVPFDL